MVVGCVVVAVVVVVVVVVVVGVVVVVDDVGDGGGVGDGVGAAVGHCPPLTIETLNCPLHLEPVVLHVPTVSEPGNPHHTHPELPIEAVVHVAQSLSAVQAVPGGTGVG